MNLYKRGFWILIGIIIGVSLSIVVNNTSIESGTYRNDIESSQRLQYGHQLEMLLYYRDLKKALVLTELLQSLYPNDAEFCFAEGWIHDMNKDSTAANHAFHKAEVLYDSLIKCNNKFSDKLNRAFIIQRLYGIESYNNDLDGILKSVHSANDSNIVENYRLFHYKPEDLFKREPILHPIRQ